MLAASGSEQTQESRIGGGGSSWKSLGVEGHYVCLQISKRTFGGIREEPISKAWTGWN